MFVFQKMRSAKIIDYTAYKLIDLPQCLKFSWVCRDPNLNGHFLSRHITRTSEVTVVRTCGRVTYQAVLIKTTTRIYVYLVVTTSRDHRNYFGSKGGSQVKLTLNHCNSRTEMYEVLGDWKSIRSENVLRGLF